jgi:hypothetical protein
MVNQIKGIAELFCLLPEGVELLEDVDDLGEVGDTLSHGEGQREERQLLQHSQFQHLHHMLQGIQSRRGHRL